MRERIHAACVFAATNSVTILLTTELLLVDVLALLMMGIRARLEHRMNANLTSWCAPQDYSIANLPRPAIQDECIRGSKHMLCNNSVRA
jgi:hypothetical protein